MAHDFKGKFADDWIHCFWPEARQNKGGEGLVNQSNQETERGKKKGSRNKCTLQSHASSYLNQIPLSLEMRRTHFIRSEMNPFTMNMIIDDEIRTLLTHSPVLSSISRKAKPLTREGVLAGICFLKHPGGQRKYEERLERGLN